jgi:endonuclease/exonuclease/phosphatase family metal-dependent hydrolase
MSRRFVFPLVALGALLAPAVAQAAAKPPTVTVMTRNLFLGADLAPAINAPTIPEAIDGAGTVWNELQATKFAERAVPLAREIKASGADLVGLQEVALWRKQEPSDGGAKPISPLPGATSATVVDQDFLAILAAELKRAGAKYKVVVVKEEFDAELPVDADHNDATGTGPLAGFGADFDARLTMRDVILVRTGSKVKVGKTRSGHFKTRYEPSVGGIKIPVDRGWTSVEARVGKRTFRFVNTHFEAFGDPKIREAQAKELTKGALKTPGQVILVGDLNSGDKKDNEPEKPGDELAFAALTKFGMKNNGARQSCCYPSLFDPAGVFDHTVDHVLSKPGLATVKARITGRDAAERTPSGLWPSDHGGVISTVRLRG